MYFRTECVIHIAICLTCDIHLNEGCNYSAGQLKTAINAGYLKPE